MSPAALAVLAGDGPRLVDPELPLIRADDLAVLRGEGVFETARAAGGRAFVLDAHLARMRRSAAVIGLSLPPEADLLALSAAALDGFGPAEASLRLVATKGPAGTGVGRVFALVTAVDSAYAGLRERGIAAVTLTLGVPATLRPEAPWLLGGVKSTSYATAMAGLRAAAAAGAEDAIWVSGDGEVLEAPTATVLVVRGGQAATPPAEEVGILPGTTVAALGDAVIRRRITVDELRHADEVALVSSVRGVAPVVRLDAGAVGTGSVGPIVTRLRDALERAFQDAVR
jgi:4-amino-4-deoxychorismate lyase